MLSNASAERTTFLLKRSTVRLMRKHWQFYVLCALPLIYIIVFKYLPMVGAQIAFRDYNVMLGMWKSDWIGAREFIRFFESPSFWVIIRNTAFISLMGIALGFPAPIILALMLNEIRNKSFKRTIQMVTYAPHFISTVVMVSMLITFLSPRLGIMGRIMEMFRVEPYDLLAVAGNFRIIYVLSNIWQHTGYGAIIYLAALSGINPELYDAAKIDGSTRLQKIWHIDIPGILPTIVILLILNSGEIMNVGFEKIYLMQNPLNIQTSEIIATYTYKMGLVNANYSFGSAVGLFNSAINLVLLSTVNWISRRMSEISLW